MRRCTGITAYFIDRKYMLCMEEKTMEICLCCLKLYDDMKYTYCPYCFGEEGEVVRSESKIKICPSCDWIMDWDEENEYWKCTNCEEIIETDEDDYDVIIED